MSTTTPQAAPVRSDLAIACSSMIRTALPLTLGLWVVCVTLLTLWYWSQLSFNAELTQRSVGYIIRSAASWFPFACGLVIVLGSLRPFVIAGVRRGAFARASIIVVAAIAVANTLFFVAILAAENAVIFVSTGTAAGTARLDLSQGQDLAVIGLCALSGFFGGGASGLLMGAAVAVRRTSGTGWLAYPLSLIPVGLGSLTDPDLSYLAGSFGGDGSGFGGGGFGEILPENVAWLIFALVSIAVSTGGYLIYQAKLVNAPLRGSARSSG